MKKLSLVSVAALMLASCSSDEMSAPTGAGTEQEVSLSFQLPSEVMSRAAQTGTNSAKGGATNCTGEVTFTVKISYGDNKVFTESATASIPNANASVTFRPTLVLGEEYNIVAYAQFDGEVAELTAIDEAGSINDETVDSYFHSGTIVAAPQMSATLYRPTGKLRIIADDFAATEKQLGKTIESIKVTYNYNQEAVFDATTGKWSSEKTTSATTEYVAIPKYTSEGDAKTLMVDYIPAPEDGTSKIIKLNEVEVIFSDKSNFKKNLSTLDVPIKRNYLTTLKGNFFTQEMELTLQIDDAFEGNAEEEYIAEVFANGGEVDLINDITLDEPLVVAAGANVVLNLNGKTIKNQVNNAQTDVIIVEEGATLTINGDGLVEAVTGNDGYAVIAKGKVIINGGTFRSGLDTNNDGNCTVYARGNGEVYINGGDFSTPEGDDTTYVINKRDADRATTTIEIKGGTFKNFNPADNKSENPQESFVAEGYKSVELTENVWTVVLGNIEGNTTLTSDVEVAETVKVAAGSTLDGDGHTMTMVKSAATYALQPAGGTIMNLTIEGYNTRNANSKVIRGIYIAGATESVTIDNVHISGVAYPLNTGSASKNAPADMVLTVTNSTLEGWTSFSGGFASAVFENCVFAASNYFDATAHPTWNNCLKPYITTVLTGCTFEKGFNIDLSALAEGATVKLVNCTIDGKAVTAENAAELLNVTDGELAW